MGKYIVNIVDFERILPDLLTFRNNDLLYIDEIGQMELYSERFKQLVEYYLKVPNSFIATISKVYHDNFMYKLLKYREVFVFNLTTEDRDIVFNQVTALLTNV